MASEPIIPWDYYQRMRGGQGSAKPDPVAETVASIRAQQAKRTIMDAPDTADDAARVSRIARATGEAPLAIEGRVADYEKAQNADYMGKVLAAIPFVGQYFADNPRALVAAQDDHKAVGLVGGALEFFKGIPAVGRAGLERGAAGLTDFYQSIDEAILPFTNPSGGRAQLDRYEREGASYRAQADAARPQTDNFVVRSAWQGIESLVVSVPALATGLVTRSPNAAAAVMGVQTGAPAYREALRAGKDTPTALRYGFEQGAIEALTEKLPASAWLDALTKRTPVGQAVLRNLATELPGEQVATVLQDFSTWATLTPDRPFSEYLAERPSAALQTAIATVTGTAVQVGATQLTARTGDALVAKVQDVRRARAHADVLTRFEKAAADSTLRKRDGEAYAAMVGDLAAKSGIESVLVPAEAVREYMQSDGYDRFSDPFESYRDQVDEAYAVGGDVVLPADFALGTLPGTAAWSALRDDIRLTSGGMSPREAQTFDDAMAEVVAEFESEMQAEYTGLQEQLDAQGKLLQSVRDKLMNAGFTPYAAAQQAELIARRITTRAARMGQEVTGGEFTTEVRQVLPPELAAARAADATDLVINALRRGKDATIQPGPSLLEWISKRGGVNDPGGDLASMGLDQWHKGKPGKRKLVRKFDAAAAMGGVSGAGDYGVDTTLRAAIDAGFFPELMELENEAGPSQLDTQVLLDAMSAELAGSKRYASDPRVDGYRAAAAELDQMLAERGLDPAEMSDAELRAVIAQMDTQGEGGFEQLPDTIDIDGVQRPTRNSEGQPIAGSEAGVRAFWNWFGDSKVVDAEGKPLVVYHGTNQPIDQFSADRLGMSTRSESAHYGFFFTSDPYVAGLYANSAASKIAPNIDEFERASEELQRKVERLEKQAIRTGNWDAYEAAMLEWETLEIDTMRADDSGQNIVPAYLAISDPVEIDFGGEGILKLDGGFGTAIKDARDGGRGGLFLKDIDDTPGETRVSDHYVAFSPTQIKSVNNRGTFDPADPRILMQSPREYYQGGGQSFADGPRGRIRFEAVPVIELFQGRNLSTLLHELGHQYLEELRFDAETPDAPAQLVQDWETVKAWFAANGHPIVDGIIPVEAHEMWARGNERYLMEGKAPSAALARVFETLRGWMLSIYKKVEALRSPITPEIREVFDRLYATDEEIQATRESQALMPLFKDAAAIGMTGPEFEAYQAQFDEARVSANGEVLAKTMAAIRRRVTAEYKEQRGRVEAEVTARVDERPLFRALRNLKSQPVNADWLRDNMGEDVFSLLPKRVPPIWKDRGVHPDTIAEMSGYQTGRQMIEALIGAEQAHRQAVEGGDQRSLRARTIQTETDAEMNAMVGDPLNGGTIEREALAAVNSEKQGEVLASELRAMSRKTGQRPTPYRIAREWARSKVRQGAYNVEASPAAIQRHTRAVAKAGGEAERALMAGKFEEAFAAKQRQMLSSALLAEAKAAGDEVEAARKRLDKIARRATSKSVDQDYLDQAHALLEAVDLRERSQKSLDRKERFADWAAARAAEGFDVVVPVSFGETLGQTNWSRLPVETLLALDAAVAQVMHLGRLKQTLLDNKERREFDAVVAEAVETAGRNGDNLPPSDLMEPSLWERAKSRVAALDTALLKMETVFDWLDGGDPNGIFNRIVFRPIADAQHNEQAKIADLIGKLNVAAEKIPAEQLKRWGDRFSSPVMLNRETGNPFVFTREQLISVALNFGNRGNIDKLMGGYGWNEGAVKAVLDENLTAEEWAYVQEVWDTIDTLWPEIEAMEKRLNGVAPERVEPAPIATPFGEMRGGYFPVVYDPARNYAAAENAARNSDLFENIYTRATTTRGFTKARTEVQRPIHLSLGVINRHVAEVVHDLTHREAIMQADKFLSNERVRRAVDEALGPQVSKAFRPWLQRIANEWAYDRAGLGGFESFLRAARLNATIVGMGFRFSTMFMQAAGFANSFEVVGERWVAPAIARSAANPIEAYNFVVERSGEVRARMDTLDRDIRDNMKRQAGGIRLDAVKRFAFHGIGYMDRVVVVPTWIGAYDKAIAAGMTEDQAIYAADKAVRQSQGSGAAKDLAAVQAGRGVAGEALKLLTMFYSYMSAFYQRQRTLGRDIGRGSVRDLPRHLARAWWLVIVPPILSEILAGRAPDEDDDEEWGAWAFKKIVLSQFGAIPVARDVMPILYAKWADERTFGYRATPATGAIESVSRLSDELERAAEGEDTKQLTRTAIETVGYFTGLTTGQIAATSQFLVDVGSGDADPQGLSDWMEGITTGKLKED